MDSIPRGRGQKMRREIEKRRDEILKNAEITLQEHKKGLISKGTVADLLKELGEN